MGGLRNRFKKDDRYVWEWHNACFLCGKNTADSLHHIIAPTDHVYVDGKHNSSILNSAPLCNHTCHIGRDAELAQKIPEFLNKTKGWIDSTDYEYKDKDRKFLEVYSEYYVDNTSNKV